MFERLLQQLEEAVWIKDKRDLYTAPSQFYFPLKMIVKTKALLLTFDNCACRGITEKKTKKSVR